MWRLCVKLRALLSLATERRSAKRTSVWVYIRYILCPPKITCKATYMSYILVHVRKGSSKACARGWPCDFRGRRGREIYRRGCSTLPASWKKRFRSYHLIWKLRLSFLHQNTTTKSEMKFFGVALASISLSTVPSVVCFSCQENNAF